MFKLTAECLANYTSLKSNFLMPRTPKYDDPTVRDPFFIYMVLKLKKSGLKRFFSKLDIFISSLYEIK